MRASRASALSAGPFTISSACRRPNTELARTPFKLRRALSWPGPDRAVSEKPTDRTEPSIGLVPSIRQQGETPMYNSINISHIFVLDQDKALDFYVNKLGMEVDQDLDLGFMRWLTVRVPGEPGRTVLLEKPGPPGMDEASAAQIRALVSKGASGFTLGLTTDDCQKTYETRKARGVEIAEEPTEHPYGVDFGLRDPFGNHLRIVQLAGQPDGKTRTGAKANTPRA